MNIRHYSLGFLVWVASFLSGQEEAATRWMVHLTAEGAGFSSTLNLINTDFGSAHRVKVIPYGLDGTRLTESEREVEVRSGQRLKADRAFLGWEGLPVSHFQIEGSNSVRASLTYKHLAENAMPAEVPEARNTAQVFRFVPVLGASWFDGLVVVNPNETRLTCLVLLHDEEGNTRQTTQVEAAPMGKWLDVLSSLFEEVGAGDYVEIRAAQPFHFAILRGSLGNTSPAVLTQVQPDSFESEAAELTFSNQIDRIFKRNCTDCHHIGGIGPFPMQTYQESYPLRQLIEREVREAVMPPWLPQMDCRPLKNPLVLDPAEKQMILDWVTAGAVEGESRRVSAPKTYEASGWSLGQPDIELHYPEPFVMEPGPDMYRCFPIPLNNEQPFQIKGAEILAGNPEIVHHVIVFIESGQETALLLDEQEDGPGYTCFGGPRTGQFRSLAIWAPGGNPTFFPENIGLTVPANSTLVMQVHYNNSQATASDQTRIGLHLAEEEREEELQILGIINTNFLIPANAKSYEVSQSIRLPPGFPIDLYAIAPHMHLLGQSMMVEVSYPDLSEECLIDVPRWDFDWQRLYEFEEPLHIPAGSTLRMRATFDNSADNIYNPNDPPIDVGWGEETTDEMALAILGLTAPIQIFGSPVDDHWVFEKPEDR